MFLAESENSVRLSECTLAVDKIHKLDSILFFIQGQESIVYIKKDIILNIEVF